MAAALEAELDDGRAQPADLHARLQALDPVAAARMEPTNRRRIVRALEVTLGAGRPFSDFGPGLEAYPADGLTQIGIRLDPEEVDRRIEARFAAMVEAGLLEEVRGLVGAAPGACRARPARPSGTRSSWPTSRTASLSQTCQEEAVRRTRQFARRQAAWFRRDPRITWAGDGREAEELVERALDMHG